MKHPHLATLSPLALAAAAVLAPQTSAQTFVQRASQVGLNHSFMCGVDRVGALPPMCDWSQIGVALGDLDGDGDQDVIALGRLLPNHVFRNDGGSFTNVTPANFNSAELDTCIALGDYDRDGDLDVYIGVHRSSAGILRSPNRLLRNEGGFQFTDVTGLSGLAGNGHTIAAKWFDFDRDGWLDLYHSEFNGVANRLHRNMGDGTFRDVTALVGAGALGSTHVSAIADLDGNGTYEILIGNDWKVSNSAGFEPNKDDIFYTRQADGTWLDVTVGAGWDLTGAPAFGSSTMGIALGDYDCDGDFDAYRTELGPQFMHRNQGWPSSGLPWVSQGDFLGVTNSTSLTPTGSGTTVGWYATFGHFDFDEWLDLWKVNGHVSSSNPRNQQDYLWTSDGPTNSFKFTDRTIAYGLQDFFDDRGAAIGDIDGDLDLDMLVAPPAGALRYWENQLDKTGKGTIVVAPVTGSSAPEGIGAVVRWTDPAGFEHSLQIGGNGVTASDDQHVALFGVGANAAADIRVEYPSGMIQTIAGVAANTAIAPEEPEMIRLSEAKGPVATGGGPLVRGTVKTTTGGGKKGPGTKPQDVGDSVSVSVWAYDRTGAPVTDLAQVDVSVAGLTATSDVTPVGIGTNQFRRWFARPTSAGEYVVTATFAGWTPSLHPTFKFFGAASSSQGTIHVDVAGVRAGSSDTFSVVYVPKDANGIALGAGQDVRLQMGADIALTALTDNGDGSYSKSFNAPATAGTKSIDIQVNGSLFTALKSLDAGGTPSSTGTLVYTETPNSGFALFPHQYKFTITPRDVSGRKLGPKTVMECTVSTTSGPTLSVRTDLVPNGTADGEYWFVIEKPVGSGASSGIATVKADGITVKTLVVSY